MSVITSFVNVIAGASVLLGGKAFMDEKITADGPSIRKVVGVPLLGVGALGILVSYVRNKRVREDKKAESDFYEAELYDAEEVNRPFIDDATTHGGEFFSDEQVAMRYRLFDTLKKKGKLDLLVEEGKSWTDTMGDDEYRYAIQNYSDTEWIEDGLRYLRDDQVRDMLEKHGAETFDAEDDPDFDPVKADRNKDGKISSWERSVGNAIAKSMRENKGAEDFGYDDFLMYHVYVSDSEDSVGFMDETCSHSESLEEAVKQAIKVAKTHGKGKWVTVIEENRDDDYEDIVYEIDNMGNVTLTPATSKMQEHITFGADSFQDDTHFVLIHGEKDGKTVSKGHQLGITERDGFTPNTITTFDYNPKSGLATSRLLNFDGKVETIDPNFVNRHHRSQRFRGEEFGAESKFDKLEDEIAAQYRKKGMSKEEADRIGAATAAKIGFKKYGKKGMVAKAKKGRRAETFDAEGGITFADVPRETLGGTNNNPVRIIVGGPPHSGKSTLMNLIEDKMNQYGVSVELRDLDFSAPTDLKGGFDQNREKKDWTPELAEEAATYFDEDSENRVILGDSIGLISRINEIVSEPADVAILLVSGSQGDDDRTYREAIKKWMQYYDDIDKPVLMVIRSSMNPEDMNYFDPHDNYGVIVGLDRNAYNQGGDSNEISLENACLEGIVFEIAQEFDLGLANRSTRRHIDIVEESWPSIRGKPTWNPIDAGKPHLARIEEDYFEELKRRKMGE